MTDRDGEIGLEPQWAAAVLINGGTRSAGKFRHGFKKYGHGG
jgi:hypothetical protein